MTRPSRFRVCPVCGGRLLLAHGVGGTIAVCSHGCDRQRILAALDPPQLPLDEATR